jgi:hypothetical protein
MLTEKKREATHLSSRGGKDGSNIEHAMRMRHIFICFLQALWYISTLSHKRHDLQKNRY